MSLFRKDHRPKRGEPALRPTPLLLALPAALLGAVLLAGCGAASMGSGPATTVAEAVRVTAATAAGAVPSGVATSGPAVASAAKEGLVQVIGASSEKSFSLADMAQMPAVEGYSGYTCPPQPGVTGPTKYKGVALSEVLEAVGGLPAGSAVSLAASDGYVMTFTTDQILKGDFTTYDPMKGTPQAVRKQVELVLAYEADGKPLNKDEGPFRLVFLTSKPEQVVEGFLCVKWVERIQVRSLTADWTLELSGVKSATLDRAHFDSLAGLPSLQTSWEDINGRTWTGIPLWVLVGLVDGKSNREAGAFDKNLATSGYQVQVIGEDGSSVTLDSAKIARSTDYVVANKMEGNPLGDVEFPLRLVGTGPSATEMIDGIKEIRLVLPR